MIVAVPEDLSLFPGSLVFFRCLKWHVFIYFIICCSPAVCLLPAVNFRQCRVPSTAVYICIISEIV